MSRDDPTLEAIVAAVRQVEQGAELADMARNLGCNNAQLLVWLGKYGTGRIVRQVLTRDRKYVKKVSYVSECSYHVAADASVASRDREMRDRLVLPLKKLRSEVSG